MILTNNVSREPQSIKTWVIPLQNLGPTGLVDVAQVVILDEAAIVVIIYDAPRDH